MEVRIQKEEEEREGRSRKAECRMTEDKCGMTDVGSGVVETQVAAAPDSAFPIPNSALETVATQAEAPPAPPPPAKKKKSPPISKLTGKPIESPVLQTPEYLRMHGLDPADYGGGRVPLSGRYWMTGPDPQEVLSRDVSKMTVEQYLDHVADLRTMKMLGSYNGELPPEAKFLDQRGGKS